MKALSITFGAAVLACNSGPCSKTSFGVGQAPNFGGQVSNSPFSSNKPWQNVASTPSKWQNSPSSVWTPSQPQQPQQRTPATPRPPNPSLAGRSPSEQLQITKCRSGQSCEKCRQLNCFWDITAKVTSRCVALGLESTQIPIEAGEASNLGYCPTTGQQGYVGVNWLAIENSGAAVPNLEGMSDANIQQWLSSIPDYDPDATDVNYPAGDAFKELLPTAAKAYADGKIPSTTPWISFFDSLSSGFSSGASSYGSLSSPYSYDTSYTYDTSYSYDLPSSDYYGGTFGASSGFASGAGSFSDSSFSSQTMGSYPSTSFSPAPVSCCGHANSIFPALQPTHYPPVGGSAFPPQLGSSFTPPLNFPPLPNAPLDFGSSFGFGAPLPTQPLAFGTPLSSQPLGFGGAFGQPIGFGAPWSG